MVTDAPWLRLENIELRRRGRSILGPLSMDLGYEGITIVMGPNGAGKTSFLRTIHGLERLSAGRLVWQQPDENIRTRQAFVFQTPILMRRSVVDCIAYPLRLDGVPRAEARERAADMAHEVGLGGSLRKPASFLSGGERQKMAMARALIRVPAVLILDEPCANLDGRSIREIETIINSVRARGTRVIMSTHHIGQARRLADDVIFLHGGKLIEQEDGDVFFDAPKTPEAAAYLKGEILL